MAKESQEVQKLKKEFYEGMLRFDQGMEKLRKERAETEELLRKLIKEKDRTDKQIENLGKQIGELTNGWGKFVEAQVQPAIPKLFRAFNIQKTYMEASSRINGRVMEVDVLGVGKEHVVVVSVKSHLRSEDVNKLLEQLPSFFRFFSEFKGKKLYGAVAGIRIDKGVPEYAEKQGLFVLGPSGETVRLLNKKGFQPRVF